MGIPGENMQVGVTDLRHFDKQLLQFCGYPFEKEDLETIFSQKEIMLKFYTRVGERETQFTFYDAKWRSPNIVQVLLKLDNYFNLANFIYDGKEKKYKLKDLHELYFGAYSPIVKEQEWVNSISESLVKWREKQIEREKKKPCHYDIINTTHFHANLECEYYEPFKLNCNKDDHRIGPNPCEPHPNPYCKQHNPYVHIATYHIEPGYVPPLPPPAEVYPDFFSTYNWKFDQNCCCDEKPKPTCKRKDFE